MEKGETTAKKHIAFLGGASVPETDRIYTDAVETARLLAVNGHHIVNGGGPGIMKASTVGAHMAGKKVLAVTYHPNHKHANFEGVDPTNNFDEEVITLDYFDRTKVMLENADVHILFKGGTGTISEFGMTWASSRIHEGHHKPIILFGDFWHDIVVAFEKYMLMRDGEADLLKIVTTPQAVLEYVDSL